jgi:hypothetical protein
MSNVRRFEVPTEMTPSVCKSIGAFAYPFRWHLIAGSLVLIASLHAAAAIDFKNLKYGLRFGGPLLSISWAALCCATWFPPDSATKNFFSRFSMHHQSASQQWQASLMVGLMLLAFPVFFVYGSFLI